MNYLDAIRINNYFNINSIDLRNLGNCREIIFMGKNGYGKTTFLRALVW